MLRLLSDENFNGIVLRGLKVRNPSFDVLRVQDFGLCGCRDPEILAHAAELGRILLTHDRATVPAYAYDRLARGLPMPGVFVLDVEVAVGSAIDQLLFLDSASDQEEWDGRVVHLPIA